MRSSLSPPRSTCPPLNPGRQRRDAARDRYRGQGNAVVAACPTTRHSTSAMCPVNAPAGCTNYATTIRVPETPFGTLILDTDTGAWLQHTGSGDAMLLYVTAGGANTPSLIVEGCQLRGDRAGAGGCTSTPATLSPWRDTSIVEFTTGDASCWWGAGAPTWLGRSP
jgi:hypothetical protein